MLDFTKEKKDCTGCTACASICPMKCIQMYKDEEGFLYPGIVGKCVHCNMCEKVCPVYNQFESMNELKKAYCFCTKDKTTWQHSTSGGAFTEICKAYAEEDTLICGAVWDNLTVHHQCIIGLTQLDKLRKSKYIESDLENVFIRIKKHLSENKRVIFCGTPCQVAGLKSFLYNEDLGNLLLIDLICHGVGSPKVFDECINLLEEKENKKIKGYEFRTKRKHYETDYIQKIIFFDDDVKIIKNDYYMQLFFKQLCLRPSCGSNCKFRSINREGDITIGDFKGLYENFPEFAVNDRNYSTVVVNTKKGEKVFEKIKNCNINDCSIENIKKYNPVIYTNTSFQNKSRDKFFEEFNINANKSILNNVENFPKYKVKITKKIYLSLPKKLKRVLRKIFR